MKVCKTRLLAKGLRALSKDGICTVACNLLINPDFSELTGVNVDFNLTFIFPPCFHFLPFTMKKDKFCWRVQNAGKMIITYETAASQYCNSPKVTKMK